MVQEAKTKYEIKSSQVNDVLILDIALIEQYLGVALPRFFDIGQSTVKGTNAQTALLKNLRKKSETTANVKGCS